MPTDPGPERSRLRDAAADATGFGSREIAMTRDLILRPRSVASGAAQDQTPYPRAFRYFLTLNGLYLLVIGLVGGFEGRLATALPPELLRAATELSGKSADSFVADLDQWFSIISVPLYSLCFYFPLAWLFKRWGKGQPVVSGVAFAFLSGWTLYGAPFGIASILYEPMAAVSPYLSLVILALLFARMGHGLWWQSAAQWLLRFVILLATLAVVFLPAATLIFVTAFAGAAFMP